MTKRNLEGLIKGLDVPDLVRLRELAGRAVGERLPGESCAAPDFAAWRGGRPCPMRMFGVAEGLKHMDGAALAALTQAFANWREQVRTERDRTSRGRVWLVYLLLRLTGARLGEALELDDGRDLDFEAGTVRLGGRTGRVVPLPPFFLAEVRAFLDRPGHGALWGRLFHLDPSFVRRKFAEQSGRSGIPRDLLTPRVLRHSRAVELLREGLPLPVVQSLLGQSSLDLASSYFNFSDEDARRLLRHHMQRGEPVRTSARNAFRGTVTAVRRGGVTSTVDMVTAGGRQVRAVVTNASADNLGLVPGRAVAAMIKAPWVDLDRSQENGAANAFKGRVTAVAREETLAEVEVELEDGQGMCSLMSVDHLDAHGLAQGDEVWCRFHPLAVILSAD